MFDKVTGLIQVVCNTLKAKGVTASSVLLTHSCFSKEGSGHNASDSNRKYSTSHPILTLLWNK